MKIEEIAFIVGLLLIPFMYQFARKFIFKTRVLLYLFVLSIIFSIVAVVQNIDYKDTKPNFFLFLFCPLYDLTIFYPSLWLFRKIKKRNPEDAPRQFIPYDDGLWLDRIYDFVLFMLWVVFPLGLLANFYS